MPKPSFILLFSLFLPACIAAQDIHQIKKFSDEQFDKGNLHLALKEYQRVLLFNEDKEYNELYSKIASIYYRMSDFDLAIRYYDFAIRVENDDSLRFELALKKALCNFNKGNYLSALTELFDVPYFPGGYLQKKLNLYMGICYFGLNEYKNSREYFSETLDSTGINTLDKLFLDLERFNKKFRPGKVELMSILLPGLGQIYTGEILSGLNSFVLMTGITIYALVTAANYTLLDGILVLSSWFYRYYSGGFTNASDFAIEKIENQKAKVYSEILALVENCQNISSE